MSQSNKVRLKVQSLSGFDKSHYHDLTTNVGTLTPVLFDELIPGSIANLNVAASVQLPPLASDAFAKVDLKLEAFAVPLRILYKGFEAWFADRELIAVDGSDNLTRNKVSYLPRFSFASDWEYLPNAVAGKGTLADYLGLKLIPDAYFANGYISLLPFIAYGKIYDEWYRSPLVQTQLFSDFVDTSVTDSLSISQLPICSDTVGYNRLYDVDGDNYWMYYVDGSTCFGLKQRNYGFDYFTNAWPSLQLGNAMSVATDSDGKFTIAALRAANSLQQFNERNLFSPRYYQAIKTRFGVDVSASVVQRPVFLGSATIPIKTFGVDVSAANGSAQGVSSNNPFADSAGAQLGRARGEGFINLIDNYRCEEPTYIMVIASVVPRAVYSSGISRVFDRYIRDGGLTDMANPLLQNTGNQPIYEWEVNSRISLGHQYSFGYTDRYADFMTLPDRISGQLREGGLLESFVLKRDFENATAAISSSFLQIPVTALDEISATDSKISAYGAWMQFGFDYKIAQPLALYSVPSLQDPAYEHGKDVTVYRGGFRF